MCQKPHLLPAKLLMRLCPTASPAPITPQAGAPTDTYTSPPHRAAGSNVEVAAILDISGLTCKGIQVD